MEKLTYINALRGLAAFFIILIHCNMFTNASGILPKIWEHLLSEWTAIFVLISGFLFQYLLPKYNQIKYLKSKFKNVILPYIFISIPAILIYVMGFKTDHNWVNIPELLEHSYAYIVSFFLATGSHLGPLWFIPVLILIFLSSKPLSIIGSNKKYLIFFGILSVFAIGFTSRPPDDSNPVISYTHFLPVYILGMFLCSNRHYLIQEKNKIIFVSLFFMLFGVELYFDLDKSFSIYTKIFLFLYLCTVFMAIPEAKLRWLNILADISFAMYFLHGYFVGFLRKIIKSNEFNFFTGFLLNVSSALFITLSVFLIYYIMKKLRINTRQIIGS